MLTSRERVRKTLFREKVDRIPIDNGGIVSGIHEIAYKNLLDYLGLNLNVELYDMVQRLAVVDDKVLRRLHIDTRYIYANAPENWTFKEDENGFWFDEWGVKYKHVGNYSESIGHPLAGMNLKEIKKYKLPDPSDKSRFKGLEEKARYLYQKTDYALVGGTISALYTPAWNLRGYEQFLLDTLIDPKLANYILDRLLDWWMEFYEVYLSKVGKYIEYLWVGDDLGQQSGPLISPENFRKNGKPRFKKLINFIKKRTDAKVAFHSCGSVYWALDDFIDMGVDIIHPLQPTAKNMDSQKINEEYGDLLVFHGGTDNQGVFHLDKSKVIKDAKYRVKAFGPGGGFIFSSGHNIQANCPPQNILALFDKAYEYGKY